MNLELGVFELSKVLIAYISFLGKTCLENTLTSNTLDPAFHMQLCLGSHRGLGTACLAKDISQHHNEDTKDASQLPV